MNFAARLALLLTLVCTAAPARAQVHDDVMSDAEVESLRDAAFIPIDRIAAYEKILDTRQKRMDDLLAKRPRPGREGELHDVIDQFAAIIDEFNDNLDEYRSRHRDIRKALPKLLQETDRWSTVLHAPPDNAAYNIVRKLALDNLKDLRDEAEALTTELDAYFKAHPEAAKAEHDRLGNEHETTRDLRR